MSKSLGRHPTDPSNEWCWRYNASLVPYEGGMKDLGKLQVPLCLLLVLPDGFPGSKMKRKGPYPTQILILRAWSLGGHDFHLMSAQVDIYDCFFVSHAHVLQIKC